MTRAIALVKLLLPPTLCMLILIAVCTVGTGCNDWERNTFQTLSASQAVVNKAQDDYEARTIPRNQATYEAINKAKAVQNAAVEAFADFERAKTAKAGSDTLQAKQDATETLLQQLPSLVAAVKAIYSATARGGPAGVGFRPGPAGATEFRLPFRRAPVLKFA